MPNTAHPRTLMRAAFPGMSPRTGVDVVRVGPKAAAAIAELEGICFGAPWSEDAVGELLADGSILAWVLRWPGTPPGAPPLGMALVRLVAGEGELIRIAIRPDARGQGAGSHLLNAVLSDVAPDVALGLHLEVRASNGAARRLYARAGFADTGTRPGYYREPVEDAILMTWRVPAGP